jgi:peptidoglycan hydrolase-like protein with peptidoglycan-binding domain
MRRITDSFIKNIVRQSLNESYGLLNEYDITTTIKIGDIPIGSTIKNMTLPQCPDGGFCYGDLEQAKKDARELGVRHWDGLIQKYCPSNNVSSRKGKGIAMGKPTMSIAQINSASGGLWEQLTDTLMDSSTIKNGLQKLENFPNFCKSEELYYGYVKTKIKNDEINDYNGFEGNNYYGINNDDADQRDSYYEIIAQLFQNTIQNTDDAYINWVDELNKKYAETKAATDIINKDAEAKKNTENKIKGGGGQQVEWLKKHPALIEPATLVDVEGGDKATLYSLDTDDAVVNQYKFGVLLVNAPGTSAHDTFQDVRVKTGTDIAIQIDPDTDKFWQFAISQNDAWRYDDVAWSDAFNHGFGGKLALTTNPDLEDDGKINKSIQTERTKGFRHNLLTEVELKYVKGKLQTGPDVVAIQKKLNISTVGGYGTGTQKAVAAFQTKKGITPVTGDVDEATWTAIMAEPDPIVPSATAWTTDLNIGSTGLDVEAIQTKLNIKKGKYGTDTQTAVMNYQKKYTDLDDTGIVDKKTFDHIMANTKLGTDIPISYSGKKHNYKKGEWIVVKPNSGNQASQLYENNGYFKILDAPDAYTIIIDADWPKGVEGYAIAGGTTAKVIFGPSADGGVKTIPTVSDNSTKGSRNKVDNSGTRSNERTSTGNVETKTRKVARNTEFCNNLIQIKQYLNTNKGGDLTVNCKKTQKTLNQIMLALTGGAQIKPVVDQPQYNVVQPESPTNQFL